MPIVTGTSASETVTGTSAADSVYGLGGDDLLVGLEGDDWLDGGEGEDWMDGGPGNDRYVIDDASDAPIEAIGQGDDSLHTSVNYTLAANVSIETMTTMFAGGTAAINLTGNEFGQSIYGNAGHNVLNGGGGFDRLVGFGGNDLYIIDALDEPIVEADGEGDDRLASSASYILWDGISVETMGTTNAASTETLHLTGNEFGQSIYGNEGTNWLSGGGGSDYLVGLGGDDILWGGDGNDNLSGGGGADVFTFGFDAGVDTITDFVSGVDRLNLYPYLGALQFTFVGSNPFSGPGQGRFADGQFSLDVNGDGVPELVVRMNASPAAGDFVFWDDIGYGTGGWDPYGRGAWDY